mmetsp:Transcript_31514/g.61506  ORF Transcript_31514/g.61506 Transcript_31514/m.61506 type:complete len:273 (-) Transcript_31514:106-924(-)
MLRLRNSQLEYQLRAQTDKKRRREADEEEEEEEEGAAMRRKGKVVNAAATAAQMQVASLTAQLDACNGKIESLQSMYEALKSSKAARVQSLTRKLQNVLAASSSSSSSSSNGTELLDVSGMSELSVEVEGSVVSVDGGGGGGGGELGAVLDTTLDRPFNQEAGLPPPTPNKSNVGSSSSASTPAASPAKLFRQQQPTPTVVAAAAAAAVAQEWQVKVDTLQVEYARLKAAKAAQVSRLTSTIKDLKKEKSELKRRLTTAESELRILRSRVRG